MFTRFVSGCVLLLACALPRTAMVQEFGVTPGFAVDNGDVNGDFVLDVSDPVYLLDHLFLGGPGPVELALCGTEPTAVESGDVNGDGKLDVSDPVRLLGWLYGAERPPAPPCALPDGRVAGRGRQGNPNPRVLPVHANAFGKTYGEWAAVWWQWAAGLPGDEPHPLYDDTGEACGVGQGGPVWFLAGTSSVIEEDGVFVGRANRTCYVPTGKAIFFPILNVVCNNFEEDPSLDDEGLLECASFFADAATGLTCVIDGRELSGLEGYRVQSPVFDLTLPENDIWDMPTAGTERAADDGYYLLLAPLSRGEHDLHFEGTFLFTVDEFGFDFVFVIDMTYHLIVE